MMSYLWTCFSKWRGILWKCHTDNTFKLMTQIDLDSYEAETDVIGELYHRQQKDNLGLLHSLWHCSISLARLTFFFAFLRKNKATPTRLVCEINLSVVLFYRRSYNKLQGNLPVAQNSRKEKMCFFNTPTSVVRPVKAAHTNWTYTIAIIAVMQMMQLTSQAYSQR